MKGRDIDCVIRGVNVAKTLADSIQSVLNCAYTLGKVNIIYVDGGSTDSSVAIAKGYEEVRVIQIEGRRPTVGHKRNAGWRAGVAPYVQFLDGDAVIAPDWFSRAMQQFQGKVVAVRGRRDERHKQPGSYNWLLDFEWNPTPGRTDAFGPEILVKRSVLQDLGGYDEELIGGEDWDLGHRIVAHGKVILHLDAPMAAHEIATTSPWQYWKDEYRTGYGYAATTWRQSGEKKSYRKAELQRVAIRGGGAFAVLVLILLWPLWTLLGLFFLLPTLIIYLTTKDKEKAQRRLAHSRPLRYLWHCSFVVVPQFLGLLRFYIGKFFDWPLR